MATSIVPEIVIRCKRDFRATAELCPATRSALDGGFTAERGRMPACQLALSITPPAPRRPTRHVRRPFTPDSSSGRYSLPRGLADGLVHELVGFRNRDAAMALAVFLARMWSTPRRLRLGFPIDRRALAGNATLGLTEAKVRGALLTLERIGFLRRMPVIGRTHRATEQGELHRHPSIFRFGPEAMEAFEAANARAARIRQRRSSTKGSTAPLSLPRPSTILSGGVAQVTKSPKDTGQPVGEIIMGEKRPTIRPARRPLAAPLPAMPVQPSPAGSVDSALARLTAARFARQTRDQALGAG